MLVIGRTSSPVCPLLGVHSSGTSSGLVTSKCFSRCYRQYIKRSVSGMSPGIVFSTARSIDLPSSCHCRSMVWPLRDSSIRFSSQGLTGREPTIDDRQVPYARSTKQYRQPIRHSIATNHKSSEKDIRLVAHCSITTGSSYRQARPSSADALDNVV